MATNQVFRESDAINQSVTCTHPTTPTSGDPVRYGATVGVAVTAEDSAGLTTVAFDGVWLLSVKGVNGAGNVAVAAGDALYYVDADTPVLSKKKTGYLAGNAVEAVVTGVSAGVYTGAITSGATATIPVRLSGTGLGIPPVSA